MSRWMQNSTGGLHIQQGDTGDGWNVSFLSKYAKLTAISSASKLLAFLKRKLFTICGNLGVFLDANERGLMPTLINETLHPGIKTGQSL